MSKEYLTLSQIGALQCAIGKIDDKLQCVEDERDEINAKLKTLKRRKKRLERRHKTCGIKPRELTI